MKRGNVFKCARIHFNFDRFFSAPKVVELHIPHFFCSLILVK